MSVMLKRPVKFIADRVEAFVTDIHAREHRVQARMALSGDSQGKGRAAARLEVSSMATMLLAYGDRLATSALTPRNG